MRGRDSGMVGPDKEKLKEWSAMLANKLVAMVEMYMRLEYDDWQ